MFNFNYYAILGISKDATADEIKKAYHSVSKKYHPDINLSPNATEMMQAINEAYATLSDENKRKAYDKNLANDNSNNQNNDKINYEEIYNQIIEDRTDLDFLYQMFISTYLKKINPLNSQTVNNFLMLLTGIIKEEQSDYLESNINYFVFILNHLFSLIRKNLIIYYNSSYGLLNRVDILIKLLKMEFILDVKIIMNSGLKNDLIKFINFKYDELKEIDSIPDNVTICLKNFLTTIMLQYKNDFKSRFDYENPNVGR